MKSEKLQFKIKKYILKFWPIIFILLYWLIFSSPYFLGNKAPFVATYQVNNFAPWSAYPEFAGPVKNGAMPDVITQIYPWKHFSIETLKNGQIPLWNPYSFSGTPHLANYQSAVLSPFNILFFVLSFIDAWSVLILLQPLLAGLFMYFLIRSFKLSKFASLISSVSFMFCGFITVWMGYGTLAYAILFLPLAILAIEKYCQTHKFWYLILLSITIPLSFFSGHFQISLYFLMTVFIYIIYKFITSKNVPNTLYLMLYAFFGLLLSLPQLLPSIEFYLQSLRSGIFMKGEAIPWQYIVTFLAPDFLGNPVTRNDWFGHYAEWNGYIGVLPLMLAIYSLTSKKRVQTFFLFVLGIFALLLALDTSLLSLLVNLHIPVLSTSAASRVIVIYSFLFAILSAFGFDELVTDLKKKRFKKIYLLFLLFLIIFFILWGMIAFKLFIPIARLAVARQNLILPTIIFGISSAIIFLAVLYLRYRKPIRFFLPFVCLLLFFIVVFDMLRFAVKWQAFDPKNLVFIETKTTQEFIKLSGYDRVFGNLGAEALVYYKLPSIEGYDALYIKRYGEFVSFINSGNKEGSSRSVVSFGKKGKYIFRAFNLLGIKYIIHKISDDNKVWTFPFWSYPQDTFKLKYNDEHYKIFENKKAFPRAFLTGKYKVVQDEQKILSTMFSDNLDLRKELVLEKDPGIGQIDAKIGKTTINRYTPNQIEILVDAKEKGMLFLSDIYYKGWIAKVDGVNSEIYRANYVFRAVPISKGKHRVEFIYDPLSFRIGVYGFFTGVVLIIGTSAILSRRRSLH